MNNDRFKFRVWNTTAQCTDHQHPDSALIDCETGKLFYYNCFASENLELENVHVEQCTGLRDKNGVLIYEGDILGYSDGRRFYIRYGQEQPVEEYCGFMIEPIVHSGPGMSDSTPNLLYMGCFKTAEIIGNVHENFELLEETSKCV